MAKNNIHWTEEQYQAYLRRQEKQYSEIHAVPKPVFNQSKRKKSIRLELEEREDYLQAQCDDYLTNEMGLFSYRIPTWFTQYILFSNISTLRKGRMLAYIKGLPDITPLFPNGLYHCCELKSRTGRLSTGQTDFRDLVTEQNFSEIRDFDTFKQLIEGFMK